jgi:glycerol kinase
MMRADTKVGLKTLHCDGGPTRNNFLMQFTADLTQTELKVSDVAESSALDAAMQGMLGLGLCQSLSELAQLPRKQKIFRPKMKVAEVKRLHDGWKLAVKRVL